MTIILDQSHTRTADFYHTDCWLQHSFILWSVSHKKKHLILNSCVAVSNRLRGVNNLWMHLGIESCLWFHTDASTLPTQTTRYPWSKGVYMEEAVLTCLVASGQKLLHSAQPIIWHLVLLDRDFCGNSMFQQRLLISVMPVVCKGKTLISLWSQISTLSTVETESAWDWGMFGDVKPWQLFWMFCIYLFIFFGGGGCED